MQPQAESPPEALAPVDTRVRFALRGVFIAIAAIGAWLAAVAPWFREWTGEQRRAFVMVWCSTALGAVSMAVFLYSRRVRAQRRSGAVRFRLPTPITRYAWLFGLGAVLLAFSLSTAIAFYQAVYPPARAFGGSWIYNFLAVENGAILAMGGLGMWWKTTRLELCDEGVLGGFGIQPWSSIRGFRFDDGASQRLVLQCRWNSITVQVDPSDKLTIEQFLASRLPIRAS
jgi:hypothetical protein